jgi:acetyl-CoA carboxylase biotin carboxylase subunit
LFKKILVANRGEIAVRIIKACQELGIATVAVYSEVDRDARHRWLADEAIPVGPASPAESYLCIEKLVEAALQTGCEAAHPGYGFLSENAQFVEALQAAGLTFIGPDPEAIRLMGDKTAARRHMQAAAVPIIPGFDGPDPAPDYASEAAKIGYPLLVKAAGGGGGKGMRLVPGPDALPYAIEAARREAQIAFGDANLYLEKYLEQPRHIEFQILADRHGTVVHLFERECSIQRRHQKIVEEAPAPALDGALREAMAQAAIRAAASAGYVNAGTVEFLLDKAGHFYFLEMNTRLQVEHPATELVTGLDLVQLQLLVAAGRPLPFSQADVSRRGHAIECRIYAEDPANDFLPSVGPLLQVAEPSGPGVRVDSGVRSGDAVTVHYDPMLAKLIVHAPDRDAAIRKMDRALKNYAILGPQTNIAFLQAVLNHSEFRAGNLSTHFIEDHFSNWARSKPPPDLAFIVAALQEALSANEPGLGRQPVDRDEAGNPWRRSDGFRVGGRV